MKCRSARDSRPCSTCGDTRQTARGSLPDAYVFGNEVGERIGSVKKAWQTAVLKAHGHAPLWVTGKKNQLAPESLAAYRAINLHFHDLRREFGSRVLESGSSLIEARDLLGHANISQTSTYLQSTAKGLGLAIERKEEHERQLADARRRESEKHSLTDIECGNPPSVASRGVRVHSSDEALTSCGSAPPNSPLGLSSPSLKTNVDSSRLVWR